jgi:hypothetical protein
MPLLYWLWLLNSQQRTGTSSRYTLFQYLRHDDDDDGASEARQQCKTAAAAAWQIPNDDSISNLMLGFSTSELAEGAEVCIVS